MLHTLALSSAPFPQKLTRSFQLECPVVLPLPSHCKLGVKSHLTGALTPRCGSTWFSASLVQGKTSPHVPAANVGLEGSSGEALQEHGSAPHSQLCPQHAESSAALKHDLCCLALMEDEPNEQPVSPLWWASDDQGYFYFCILEIYFGLCLKCKS